MVTDSGSLTDDNASTVVDEEVFADLRAGVDVDTGLRVRVFRHHARDHRDLVLIQLVCDAVDEDGEHAGVREQDLLLAVSRRIALKVCRQVLEQQLLNGRDALDECRADRIGHFAVLVALRHRQRDLARQLFMDVLHQKCAVLLRRQLQEVAVAVVNRENELLTVADDLDDRITVGHAQRIAVHGDLRALVVRRHAVSRRMDDGVLFCFVHS